jgi:hypothetical protein
VFVGDLIGQTGNQYSIGVAVLAQLLNAQVLYGLEGNLLHVLLLGELLNARFLSKFLDSIQTIGKKNSDQVDGQRAAA